MGIQAMHDLDMMTALCQLVGQLVDENTISPKVVRRIKCGHHAKTHERIYSSTPSLLMEQIHVNLMTMPHSHQDSILEAQGHFWLSTVVWPGLTMTGHSATNGMSTHMHHRQIEPQPVHAPRLMLSGCMRPAIRSGPLGRRCLIYTSRCHIELLFEIHRVSTRQRWEGDKAAFFGILGECSSVVPSLRANEALVRANASGVKSNVGVEKHKLGCAGQ
ncbi:MAG: hypothetical protein H7Y39_16780 [Nitrospiraceae bacterium]|nr:hypothetical protein [Nitrospiraceae bacterium]